MRSPFEGFDDWPEPFEPCSTSTGSPVGSPIVTKCSFSSGRTSPVWKRKSFTVQSPGFCCGGSAANAVVAKSSAAAVEIEAQKVVRNMVQILPAGSSSGSQVDGQA